MGKEMMMVGWDEDELFPLPTDPGPIHKRLLRAWYWVEDWWRFLDPMQKATIGLLIFAITLWIVVSRG